MIPHDKPNRITQTSVEHRPLRTQQAEGCGTRPCPLRTHKRLLFFQLCFYKVFRVGRTESGVAGWVYSPAVHSSSQLFLHHCSRTAVFLRVSCMDRELRGVQAAAGHSPCPPCPCCLSLPTAPAARCAGPDTVCEAARSPWRRIPGAAGGVREAVEGGVSGPGAQGSRRQVGAPGRA